MARPQKRRLERNTLARCFRHDVGRHARVPGLAGGVADRVDAIQAFDLRRETIEGQPLRQEEGPSAADINDGEVQVGIEVVEELGRLPFSREPLQKHLQSGDPRLRALTDDVIGCRDVQPILIDREDDAGADDIDVTELSADHHHELLGAIFRGGC